jgi:hypothetical protein
MVVISARVVLSSSFIQLLRYAASSDARRATVRLRSAKTASLAFEPKSLTQNLLLPGIMSPVP